ncbi:MAG: hypothetical protein JSV04_05435 [Candidatus Heimdallarchaeota archaeon]|nr:MAG: hypothetical protein JSV04_05435 [Candidatus Heimdallarchaeota archaeon]
MKLNPTLMDVTTIKTISSLVKNKRTRDRASELIKYAFAHHPTCGLFRGHVYSVKGWWVCKGCALTYPTAIFSFLFWGIIRIDLELGLSIVFVTGVFSFIGLIGLIPRKIAFVKRIFLGFFAGTYFHSLFLTADLLILVLGLIIFSFILMFFSLIRYSEMKGICNSCIYEGDWETCEGFFAMKKALFKHTVFESEYSSPPEPGRIKET